MSLVKKLIKNTAILGFVATLGGCATNNLSNSVPSFENALMVQVNNDPGGILLGLDMLGYEGVVCAIKPKTVYDSNLGNNESGICSNLPLNPKDGGIIGLNGIDISSGGYNISNCRYSQVLGTDNIIKNNDKLKNDKDLSVPCFIKVNNF